MPWQGDNNDNYSEVVQNTIVADMIKHDNNFGPHGGNELIK